MSRDPGHLMNAVGVAQLLGVSRQRVHQIVEADATFPDPVAVLGRTRVWQQSAVEAWMLVPGHRRVVNYRDKGELLRFGVVQEPTRADLGGMSVIVPTADVAAHRSLRWTRDVGRLELADPINPEQLYVSLGDWDARVAVDGSPKPG